MRHRLVGLGIAALIAASPAGASANGPVQFRMGGNTNPAAPHQSAGQTITSRFKDNPTQNHIGVVFDQHFGQWRLHAGQGNPCPSGDIMVSPGHCVFPDAGFHGIVHLP